MTILNFLFQGILVHYLLKAANWLQIFAIPHLKLIYH